MYIFQAPSFPIQNISMNFLAVQLIVHIHEDAEPKLYKSEILQANM